jgi:hypothetical protein
VFDYHVGNKFRPNRRIFVFWLPFLVQNGHHSKPKWLPYVHFWIFILAAILNILKTEHNFEWWSIFWVKFQKDLLYGLNLTFFAPWLPWQRPPFWICSTSQKLLHTTVDIPTKFYEVWWKESKFFLNPPFFVSRATAEKFVQPIPIRSTRCGCCSLQVSSICVWQVTWYDHFCVFQFFCILAISMATMAILKIPKYSAHLL